MPLSLFATLAPRGFDTIAIETGPVLAAKLRGWLASSSGRAQHAKPEAGIADKEYARMVCGYDFLLLIPNTTADPPIAPNAF